MPQGADIVCAEVISKNMARPLPRGCGGTVGTRGAHEASQSLLICPRAGHDVFTHAGRNGAARAGSPFSTVAVGTCISWHAPRPDPYVRLSRIRLLPRVCDGTSCRIRSSACDTRAWF